MLNIITVRMKSRPKTDNEEITTLRVVAEATPSGVGLRHITLQQCNESHGNAKHHTFDHAIANVFEHINAALHLAPKRTGINTNEQNTHGITHPKYPRH